MFNIIWLIWCWLVLTMLGVISFGGMSFHYCLEERFGSKRAMRIYIAFVLLTVISALITLFLGLPDVRI